VQEAFRKMLTFLAGLTIVIGALVDECPRVAAVSIGLLLMGIFTVPEAFGIIKGMIDKEKDN
jgi:hypothetical protein